MKKVSIIVPVYNVQDYLENCITSLISQTYENIEIVLVDDGSTDNSPKICDSFAEKDKRINVIHTENQGVSSARNIGLDNSTGELIAFVDSDDYALPNYIESLVSCLEKNNSELSVCLYKMNTDNKIFDIEGKNSKVIYDVKKDRDFFELYQHSLTPSVWGKLFIKSKITEKFIQKLSYGEDDLFILNYLKNVKTVSFANQSCYVYRNDSRETLTRKAYKNLLNLFEELQQLRENAIKQICDSKLAYSALAMSNIRQTTIMLEANIKTNNSYKKYKKLFKQLKSNNYFKSQLKLAKHRNFKELVILLVYKLNVPIMLYRFLKEK